jgi:hypothetical protein
MTTSDDKAEIKDTVLDGLDPGVAAGKKEQLNAGTKGVHLRGRHAPVQLESDEIILVAGGPFPSPQIRLPGGQKGVPGCNFATVIKLDDPSVVKAPQGSDSATAPQIGSAGRRLTENVFVQQAARDADGRKRESAADRDPQCVDIHRQNRNGAKRGKINAQAAKIVYSLTAYELAANLIMWVGLSFDQDDLAPGMREVGGDGAASDAAADNQRMDRVCHRASALQRQSGSQSIPNERSAWRSRSIISRRAE